MAESKKSEAPKPRESELAGDGRGEYLVCSVRGSHAQRQGLAPMSAGQMAGLKNFLESTDDIELLNVIKPSSTRFSTASALEAPESREHYVVRMNARRAAELGQSGRGQVIVGENLPLSIGQGLVFYPGYAAQPVMPWANPVSPALAQRPPPRVRLGQIPESTVQLRVLGAEGKPVEGASVTLQGSVLPQSGKTDAEGMLSLSVILPQGQPPAFLQVSEVPNCWDFYVERPRLERNTVNIIRMTPLSETLPGFPQNYRLGWGQRLMGLGQTDALSGEGVKIAIVDSGTDAAHPLLSHIQRGVDLTGPDSGGWQIDQLGHGTHVSGVIGANGAEGMMRGFAPKAEIHSLKIFPGGNLSTLVEALDYCIDNGIDLVNLSLGTSEQSDAFVAVEQKIEEAAEAGIACIVAAGNNSGPVQFPANSPNTLAVAALGKLGEFPSISWNEFTIQKSLITPQGLFSPTYTSFGPEVTVSAPGSAIVSTWPGNSFAPDSGTSMAAPHVCGLAAIVLAHHAAFQQDLSTRNAERVKALFTLLTQVASPIAQLGRERTGAGVPTLNALLSSAPR